MTERARELGEHGQLLLHIQSIAYSIRGGSHVLGVVASFIRKTMFTAFISQSTLGTMSFFILSHGRAPQVIISKGLQLPTPPFEKTSSKGE